MNMIGHNYICKQLERVICSRFIKTFQKPPAKSIIYKKIMVSEARGGEFMYIVG